MKHLHWLAAAWILVSFAPAAAQQRIDRPGTIDHVAADAHFPEQVGEFRRSTALQYDQRGDDMSASYVLAHGDDRLVVTVYVYPAVRTETGPGPAPSGEAARAALCRREFAGVGEAIETQPQYRGARRLEQGAAPAIEGVGADFALRSVHSFTAAFLGRDQEIRSETDLYCFVGGRWLVKYRASSSAGFDVGPAIETFIRTGPWPGRAAPPEPDKVVSRV